MCHHTWVFGGGRARLAFGVWWLRHSMKLSPYLEFLSFNTTTVSHNRNTHHILHVQAFLHTRKNNLCTWKYV
jgi:hypothetical protein